jgi:hypothetical protein
MSCSAPYGKRHSGQAWLVLLCIFLYFFTVYVRCPLSLPAWLAAPLLSPDIKWFVLFIEVGCTANQFNRPSGVPSTQKSSVVQTGADNRLVTSATFRKNFVEHFWIAYNAKNGIPLRCFVFKMNKNKDFAI